LSKLSLEKVSVVRDGRETLAIGHLAVEQGELLAVLGPNGAGKSTLIQVLGLLTPFEGTVGLDGQPVTSPLAARRRMAVVFQDPLLLKGSVADNVQLGLRMRGVGGNERARLTGTWLERFGVGHLARRPASTLSGGEAQRVALARAFVLEPEVLLLDEPFGALDVPTREQLLRELHSILRETGVATIFVTHDRDEALRLADRIAVLFDGRLRQLGTPYEVFGTPLDEEVAEFVGVETVVRGVVRALHDNLLTVAVGEVCIEASGEFNEGAPVLVCLRPEDVTLLADQPSAISARNHLSAVVTGLIDAGRMIRVELDCGFPLVAVVTRLSAQELELREGQSVVAAFKAPAVHLIPA
jgi:molybdopterin-binding protein